MARWTRRRRRTGVWLPNVGTVNNQYETGLYDWPYLEWYINGTQTRGNAWISTPLVLDHTADFLASSGAISGGQAGEFAQRSLEDYMRGGYLFKRLLGSFKASIADYDEIGINPCPILLTAGIIVRRVNPDNADTAFISSENGSPSIKTNIQDPWMWRRSWILSGRQNGTGGLTGFWKAPQTTAGYSGIHSGEYVDIKSRRSIKQEERLYLNVSANWLPTSEVQFLNTHTMSLHGVFDYRVFGSPLRGPSGNRNNSVR